MQTRFLTCLTALLGCAPLIADDSDLLGMISEESDLVLHLPNTSKTRANWEKSSMKGFTEQDQIKAKLDEFITGLLDFEEIDDKKTAELLKTTLTTLYESFDEEILFTIATPTADTDLVKKFKSIKPKEDQDEMMDLILGQFGGLILAEVGDQEKEAEAAIADLVKVIKSLAAQAAEDDEDDNAETTIVKKKIGETELSIVHIEEGEMSVDLFTFGVVNKVLFVSFGNHEPEAVIQAIKKGHKTPLSDSEMLATGASDLQLIMDTKDMMAAMQQFLAVAGEGMAAAGVDFNLDAGWEALGMSGFGQIAMSIDMSQPEVNIVMNMEAPSEGLMGSMMPTSKLDKASIHAHQGVLSTTQYRYDWPKMYDEIMATVRAFSPKMGTQMISQLAEMEGAFGVTLKNDILDNLDTDFVLVEYPDDDLTAQQMKKAFIVGVKDQAKLEAALNTLVGGMGQEIESEDYLGQKINHVSVGADNAISYCFHEEQIIIGIRAANAVKEALKQINKPRPTLWEEDFLKEHQDYIQSGLSHLGVMDVDSSITSAISLFSSMSDDETDWSDLELPFGYSLYGMTQKDNLQSYRFVLFPKK